MKKKYTSFANRLTKKVMLTVLVTLVLLSGIIFVVLSNSVHLLPVNLERRAYPRSRSRG